MRKCMRNVIFREKSAGIDEASNGFQRVVKSPFWGSYFGLLRRQWEFLLKRDEEQGYPVLLLRL